MAVDLPENPNNREEQYLANIAGQNVEVPACPWNRKEAYLADIGDRLDDIETEIETIKDNPDVADIVNTYADLQAYDKSALTDKDIIRVLNDETHDGNSTYYRYNKATDSFTYIGSSKTYDVFVGTDGTAAGTKGLVPAPTASDANKYLKSDGTWSTGSSYTLPAATSNTLGGVKIGSNLSMDANDVLSATDTTYTAGTNISISSGNVISATDTTYSNFVGTDGTAAGTAGLVPAPATTDAGKVLKADGSWGEAGGGIKTLTVADYNYPTTGTKTLLATYLLDAGIYKAAESLALRLSSDSNGEQYARNGDVLIVTDQSANRKVVYFFTGGLYAGAQKWATDANGSSSGGGTYIAQSVLTGQRLKNNLTTGSFDANYALDARQGKVLKDLIDSLVIKNAGAPTTSTVGTVGMLLEDTTNGKLYQCTEVSGSTYIWKIMPSGYEILAISQTDYDNLQTYDPNTLYVITGA